MSYSDRDAGPAAAGADHTVPLTAPVNDPNTTGPPDMGGAPLGPLTWLTAGALLVLLLWVIVTRIWRQRE